MTDFSGFEMPLQYNSIKEEHIAVRTAAGLFDVSHMGEILIGGPQALKVLQELSVNDAGSLSPGQCHYSVMCRENGGIVDDLLVYRLAEEQYMLVVNASNTKKDLEWILSVNQGRADVSNISDEIALIALQGPKASRILEKVVLEDEASVPPFEFRTLALSHYDNLLVSATGYTGEAGFEIYANIRHVNVVDLWNKIMEAGRQEGIKPCGLAARDTLRLEAGLLLYGNDINDETTPVEAGLSWLVRGDNNFIGREIILNQKTSGANRKRVGIVMDKTGKIPRPGCAISNESGHEIGVVGSGGLSVTTSRGIAMGYVPVEFAGVDTPVYIDIRGKKYAARVVSLPFYKRKK